MVLKKLKSSSLIEVIIALCIGMMIIALSMSIVVKTGKNYNAFQRGRAMLLMSQRAFVLQNNPETVQDSLNINGMVLLEKLSSYREIERVFQLHMKCYSSEGRFLGEKKCLLEITEKNEDE